MIQDFKNNTANNVEKKNFWQKGGYQADITLRGFVDKIHKH